MACLKNCNPINDSCKLNYTSISDNTLFKNTLLGFFKINNTRVFGYPRILKTERDDLICLFNLPRKPGAHLKIKLTKNDANYVFDTVSNLDLLFELYPEFIYQN